MCTSLRAPETVQKCPEHSQKWRRLLLGPERYLAQPLSRKCQRRSALHKGGIPLLPMAVRARANRAEVAGGAHRALYLPSAARAPRGAFLHRRMRSGQRIAAPFVPTCGGHTARGLGERIHGRRAIAPTRPRAQGCTQPSSSCRSHTSSLLRGAPTPNIGYSPKRSSRVCMYRTAKDPLKRRRTLGISLVHSRMRAHPSAR